MTSNFIQFLDLYYVRNHYHLLTIEAKKGDSLIQWCRLDLMTTVQSIIVSLGMCLAGLTGFLFERTSFGVGQKLLVLRKSLQIREMSNVTNLLFLTKLFCAVWARSLGQAQDER